MVIRTEDMSPAQDLSSFLAQSFMLLCGLKVEALKLLISVVKYITTTGVSQQVCFDRAEA